MAYISTLLEKCVVLVLNRESNVSGENHAADEMEHK